MKGIVLLGSTGSIGAQTLKIVSKNPNKFKILGLACFSNTALLEDQIQKLKPETVCVFNKNAAAKLAVKIPQLRVLSGEKGLRRIAGCKKADLIVNAISGVAGLAPSISALKAGKNLALANKESMVIAGGELMREAKRRGVKIIPIDSEITAIFQILEKTGRFDIKKVILPASGGPFFGKSRDELARVTVEDALNHPKWSMGKKVTIDSATMMNKAFEIIEAVRFFKLAPSQIEVLIHPECFVHAIVEFADGQKMAFVSEPDMKFAIEYALNYPKKPLRFFFRKLNSKKFTFLEPDFSFFEGPKLAYEALEIGSSAPALLCYADEIAVRKFLEGEIRFAEIYEVIKGIIKNPKFIFQIYAHLSLPRRRQKQKIRQKQAVYASERRAFTPAQPKNF